MITPTPPHHVNNRVIRSLPFDLHHRRLTTPRRRRLPPHQIPRRRHHRQTLNNRRPPNHLTQYRRHLATPARSHLNRRPTTSAAHALTDPSTRPRHSAFPTCQHPSYQTLRLPAPFSEISNLRFQIPPPALLPCPTPTSSRYGAVGIERSAQAGLQETRLRSSLKNVLRTSRKHLYPVEIPLPTRQHNDSIVLA